MADQEYERRIGECEVKIENCETRIKVQKDSGEDKQFLIQRLKDLNAVRDKLVKAQNAS